jgi:DNA-binding Xre family transcriptional regulator
MEARLMPRFDPDKLNRALAERNLDGDLLAEITGLHRSVISRARQGRPVRIRTMVAITAALDSEPVNPVATELLA